MITLKQASVVVGLSADTMRKYIFDKRIKAVKMGRDWFLPPATVEKLKNRRRYNREQPDPE